jgi:hypothetical protein
MADDETPEKLRAEIKRLRQLGWPVTDQGVLIEIAKLIVELERRLGEAE